MNIKAISLNRAEIGAVALIILWFGLVVTYSISPKINQSANIQSPSIFKVTYRLPAAANTRLAPIASPMVNAKTVAIAKPISLVAPYPIAQVFPLTAPIVLSRVIPDYPANARMQGVSGVVLAKIVISADGQAKTVLVAESSGSQELDQAAVSALKKWTFSPAIQNGIATEVCYQVPVRFNLYGN